MKIEFSGKRAYDPGHTSVSFQVFVDTVANRCLISEEALQDHFGAASIDPDSLLSAFDSWQARIEGAARERILQGVALPFILESKDF